MGPKEIAERIAVHPLLRKLDPQTQHLIVTLVSTLANDRRAFEVAFARAALQLLTEFEEGRKTPGEVDQVFTALDVALDDFLGREGVSSEVADVLFEGMLFHDLGKAWGPDVNGIRDTCIRILRKNGQR